MHVCEIVITCISTHNYNNTYLMIMVIHARRFGFCEVLISDQGREFVNQVNTELFRFTGTEHRVTSAYHPQTNGLTERFNQTLQTALLKYVNDSQTDWDYHLPAILFAYRTSKQKATKYSPFELMFCRWVVHNYNYYNNYMIIWHACIIIITFHIQETCTPYSTGVRQWGWTWAELGH